MAGWFRFFTKRVALLISFTLSGLYLLSCLAPYLKPENWWLLSIFGLAFPYLCIILLWVVGFWLLLRRKWGIVFAVILLLGSFNIKRVFGFHFFNSFQQEKQEKDIRILSWNVARFVEIRKNWNKGSQTRLHMLELIRAQDADILCLQEFHDATKPGFYQNINAIKRDLGYPYHYFLYDEDGDRLYYGSVIFSRFPFIDTGAVRYPRPALPDALMHVDVKVGGDTLRVFTTHLQSVQFKKEDYENIERIKSPDDSIIQHSKPIIAKLKQGLIYRSYQADLIRKELDKTNKPFVICGDFNDTPNSYTYRTIRGSLQDAFLENSRGVGRTYASLAPTLRIDFILASQPVAIRQYNRVVKPYSDHYMLLADIRLPTKN